MTRLLSGFALFALSVSAEGGASDAHQSMLNQREVRACMLRRMTADKSLSYNDAKKLCADQAKAQSLAAPLTAPRAAPLAAASR